MQTKLKVKVAAVATGLAMATSMLSLAPLAHAAALRADQVQAILTLLSSFGADATIVANVQASLTGGTPTPTPGGTTGGACAVPTVDLKLGSTGAQVIGLQTGLVAGGYLVMPAGVAMGNFGPLTQAAVIAWQKAAGVSPAAGYFGSISRAAFNLCKTSGTDDTPTTVTGLTGAGRLTGLSSLGDVTADLSAGDASTKVIGLSVDATGGDVALQRVDVQFLIASSGGSANLNKYISSADLYLDGKKLASIDPASGDQSSRTWTYRFTGLNGVIKSGTTGKIYVQVTPVSSIGTNEDGDTITVSLEANSVRAVGGDGISDTYVASGDSVATGNPFTVSSATTGSLVVSAASDNPIASLVMTSSSTKTGVTLLKFNMKAKDSNVKITDLKAALTTNDSLSDVVNTVYLMKGTEVVSSKTVSSGVFETITFNNINRTISKDATEAYSIVVDLKGQTAAAYADGTTLSASTTLVSAWTASDSEGASVTTGAVAGGNTMTLSGTGITIVQGTIPDPKVSVSGYSGGLDTATFEIPFTVTAGDTDVYIVGSATKGAANSAGVAYATTTTSTSGKTQEPTASVSASGTVSGDSAGSYYKVLANTSRGFQLNVAVTASTTATAASAVGIAITSIEYGTGTTGDSYYTSNISAFATKDAWVKVN